MRSKYLVIILVLLALSVLTSPAQAGSVVSVCDEAHLLAALAGGGTVTFTCNGTITITNTVTIVVDTTIDSSGQSVTISGNNAVRVFYVNQGITLNLKSLTIADGNGLSSPAFGGAIYNDRGTLTVNNCTFSNNSAAWLGGGIYNGGGDEGEEGANLSVVNSTFFGNSAGESGGAIYNSGGTTIVVNSTFSENSASAYYGGAIFNGWESALTVSYSTFSNNGFEGSRGGGAIRNYNGTANVSYSDFSGNRTGIFGGGISIYLGTVSVSNSTFSSNSGNYGGGISNERGNLVVRNSTFSSNSANSDGGGMAIWGYSNVSVRNSTFSGNSANSYGSNLYNGSTLILENTIVTNGAVVENCYAYAPIIDGGGNLSYPDTSCPGINSDPILGSLQDNGGYSKTHALLAGSPAIDAGTNSVCPTTDQRGFPRSLDGDKDGIPECDMGSYEWNSDGSIKYPPTISDISDLNIREDHSTFAIPFRVSDPDTPLASLTILATSSNLSLIPSDHIILGGSGADRTIALTPLANLNGSAIITITISDGNLSTSDSFLLTVKPINDAPVISDIHDQSTNEDTSTPAISLTINDLETPASSLTLTADSSNPNLIPPANITFGGTGFDRTLTLTPAPDQYGTTTITVTVSDGALTTSDSFSFTVNPVNDAPVLSAIGNRMISMNKFLTFVASAFDIEGDTLTFSLDPGAPAGATIDPASGFFTWKPTTQGSFNVTLRVRDSGSPVMEDFETITITVNSSIYLPVLSKPGVGIYGNVTVNGVPATGTGLYLRFYDGVGWSTAATTTTDLNGYYSFTSVPSLVSGQIYYVRYANEAKDPSRLSSWWTQNITSYAAGSSVHAGDFDLADIKLSTPIPGANVSLPTTFGWVKRPATPWDSYEFNLYLPENNSPYFYSDHLGYFDQYILTNLPSGFQINSIYGWYVAVYSPDGGYGESHYYREITFSGGQSFHEDSGRVTFPRGFNLPLLFKDEVERPVKP